MAFKDRVAELKQKLKVALGPIAGLILTLAIRFGLAFLFLKFPWLPPELRAILEELIDRLRKSSNSDDKKAAKTVAIAKVKDHCNGKSCSKA